MHGSPRGRDRPSWSRGAEGLRAWAGHGRRRGGSPTGIHEVGWVGMGWVRLLIMPVMSMPSHTVSIKGDGVVFCAKF